MAFASGKRGVGVGCLDIHVEVVETSCCSKGRRDQKHYGPHFDPIDSLKVSQVDFEFASHGSRAKKKDLQKHTKITIAFGVTAGLSAL
jgi:hypothetical protein